MARERANKELYRQSACLLLCFNEPPIGTFWAVTEALLHPIVTARILRRAHRTNRAVNAMNFHLPDTFMAAARSLDRKQPEEEFLTDQMKMVGMLKG